MKLLFALWLGFLALAAASRSQLQQRAVELVLEDFHRKNYVQWSFKEEEVEQVMETEYPEGPFVWLQLTIRQTQCRKEQGRSQDCAFKRNGRKRSCRACFKFNSSSPPEVLDQYVHCMMKQQLAVKEIERRDDEECTAVQKMGQIHYLPGIYGLPGRFASFQALPPSDR